MKNQFLTIGCLGVLTASIAFVAGTFVPANSFPSSSKNQSRSFDKTEEFKTQFDMSFNQEENWIQWTSVGQNHDLVYTHYRDANTTDLFEVRCINDRALYRNVGNAGFTDAENESIAVEHCQNKGSQHI